MPFTDHLASLMSDGTLSSAAEQRVIARTSCASLIVKAKMESRSNCWTILSSDLYRVEERSLCGVEKQDNGKGDEGGRDPLVDAGSPRRRHYRADIWTPSNLARR